MFYLTIDKSRFIYMYIIVGRTVASGKRVIAYAITVMSCHRYIYMHSCLPTFYSRENPTNGFYDRPRYEEIRTRVASWRRDLSLPHSPSLSLSLSCIRVCSIVESAAKLVPNYSRHNYTFNQVSVIFSLLSRQPVFFFNSQIFVYAKKSQ